MACAGVAKGHGHDGDGSWVVEELGAYVHPLPEAIAALVSPGDSSFVSDAAGGLTNDKNATLFVGCNEGPWAEGELVLALGAGSDLSEKRSEDA